MDLDFIALTIDGLGRDLKSLVEQDQAVLNKTKQDSEEIAHIVIELLALMQHQDLVRQRLNEATDVLDDVVSHAVGLTAAIDAARHGKDLSRLAEFSKTAIKTVTPPIPVDGDRLIELF